MKARNFADLYAKAEKTDEYWTADAVYGFTEELHRLSVEMGISRSEMARRLGTSPAYVTKIFRGDVNFTVETMVKLARAIGCGLELRLVAPARGYSLPKTLPHAAEKTRGYRK
jgi:transcriptional regulator with XRE-family HTH domain